MSETNRAETVPSVVAYAIGAGFLPEVSHRQTYGTDDVQTYLFTLRRNAAV